MNIPLGVPTFAGFQGHRFSIKRFLRNNTLKFIPESGWPKAGTLLRLPQVVYLTAANYRSAGAYTRNLWVSRPRNSREPVVQWFPDGAPDPGPSPGWYQFAKLASFTSNAYRGTFLNAAAVAAEVKRRIEAARPGITFVVTDTSLADAPALTYPHGSSQRYPILASPSVDNGDMPIPIASRPPSYSRYVPKVFTPDFLGIHVGVPYFDVLDSPFEDGLNFRDSYVAAITGKPSAFPRYAVRAFSDGAPAPTASLSNVDLGPLERWVDYNGDPPDDLGAYVENARGLIDADARYADNPRPDAGATYELRQADLGPEGVDYRYMGLMPRMDADAIVALIADHFGFEGP